MRVYGGWRWLSVEGNSRSLLTLSCIMMYHLLLRHAKSAWLSPLECPDSPLQDLFWVQRQAEKRPNSRTSWGDSQRIWILVWDLIPPNYVRSRMKFVLAIPWVSQNSHYDWNNKSSITLEIKHFVLVWFLCTIEFLLTTKEKKMTETFSPFSPNKESLDNLYFMNTTLILLPVFTISILTVNWVFKSAHPIEPRNQEVLSFLWTVGSDSPSACGDNCFYIWCIYFFMFVYYNQLTWYRHLDSCKLRIALYQFKSYSDQWDLTNQRNSATQRSLQKQRHYILWQKARLEDNARVIPWYFLHEVLV